MEERGWEGVAEGEGQKKKKKQKCRRIRKGKWSRRLSEFVRKLKKKRTHSKLEILSGELEE